MTGIGHRLIKQDLKRKVTRGKTRKRNEWGLPNTTNAHV